MTDVRLVKDCGLYPSYKKIIDFTGTKSEIISKQLAWIETFNPELFSDVNYNKVQNKLVLPIDYMDAMGYTYAVLTDVTGTGNDRPLFMFINGVGNLSNGEDIEPSVAFDLSLDPIMTYMGEYSLDECLVTMGHTDRWLNGSIKRITPTNEGVIAYNKTINMHRLNDLSEYPDIAICVITFTSPYQKYDFVTGVDSWERTKEFENTVYQGVFLVDLKNPDNQLRTKVDYTLEVHSASSTKVVSTNSMKFPSLKKIIDGTFQADLPIVDQSIVSFTMSPVTLVDIDVEEIAGEPHYNLKGYVPKHHLNVPWETTHIGELEYDDFQMIIDYKDEIEFNIITGSIDIDLHNQSCIIFKDVTNIQDDYIDMRVDWSIPEQPIDGAEKDVKYEPAMFMSPFMSRKIVRGDGTIILEIPDINIESNIIRGKQIINSAGITNMFTHLGSNLGEQYDMANGELAVDNAVTLDVTNDQWKEYVYTKKETDREMVNNYAWKNAIDNLIYMSYGGSLVGSRSSTDKPIFQGIRGEGAYSGVRFYNGGDMGSLYPWEHTTDYAGKNTRRLSPTGKRLISATGIAAGASIVTSLVDAHTMWENQKAKEKQIRNEPTSVSMVGEGVVSVLNGYKDYYVAEQRVDDINYNRAFENFWKYGYIINKFEKPDTNSRKYFNYILTNGAIVNGAINQGIRDVIASIYDAGVTIFHYDSGDTTTRNLEYTDKENIEVSLI